MNARYSATLFVADPIPSLSSHTYNVQQDDATKYSQIGRSFISWLYPKYLSQQQEPLHGKLAVSTESADNGKHKGKEHEHWEHERTIQAHTTDPSGRRTKAPAPAGPGLLFEAPSYSTWYTSSCKTKPISLEIPASIHIHTKSYGRSACLIITIYPNKEFWYENSKLTAWSGGASAVSTACQTNEQHLEQDEIREYRLFQSSSTLLNLV